jgi:hypothetical protein
VGAVDAGMIGAFVLFGIPEETVFPAILIFRLVAFWMPIPPGVFAFFQLRHTVHVWEEEGRPIERGGEIHSPVEEVAAIAFDRGRATIKSKVLDFRRRK